ncbi:hypothetical protein [Micromonospora profundi]|uniref:hypothetical protein n=1 Tax=Micromonospora profundi TaxID=1420889 RepID=UPI0036B9C843
MTVAARYPSGADGAMLSLDPYSRWVSVTVSPSRSARQPSQRSPGTRWLPCHRTSPPAAPAVATATSAGAGAGRE